MTTFIWTKPTARKWHTCEMCRRTIRPGEMYHRMAGLDGQAWTRKECAHCRPLVDLIVQRHGYDEYDDDLIDGWDPDGIPEARVWVQWKRKWTRRDGCLYPVPVLVTEEITYPKGWTVTRLVSIKPGEDSR